MAGIGLFNISGRAKFTVRKDSRWLSTPYVHENTYLTGFSQVNLRV
jgi:hypothetical protein